MIKIQFAPLFLVIVLFVSCGNSLKTSSQNDTNSEQEVPVIQNINESAALPMLNDSAVITIDVRTNEEVSRGYIDGADLFIDVNGDFQSAIAGLDKTKTYLVYCHSGGRSSNAVNKMKSAGFTSLYNLTGGISNWNGPVRK